ncbi:MAG: DUF4328 domain-containing protein [Mycobacterium sp.]|nr:DUF4328 domain-containing protein [Mycobacterium sp.]
MIQVCSRCGTRWNVRDQERTWCPRCRGPLMSPAEQQPVATSRPPVYPVNPKRASARPSTGFRWIAVRPGPPPPPRRPARPLGPTPRYHTIPRWGLVDRIAMYGPAPQHARRTASETAVRATVLAAAVVLALAAAAHVLRYLLLLINRTTIAAVIAAAAVSTSWLIGRRAAVFGSHGLDDPRPEWALWAGCLIPVVNLVWAPVFVIELARAEHSQSRLKTPVLTWWIAWVFSTGICLWATWTSGATEPQGVADNTVMEIIAYLAGLATLLLLLRVVDIFVDRPVQRPLHRWVVVTGDDDSGGTDEPQDDESRDAVESGDREPAA